MKRKRVSLLAATTIPVTIAATLSVASPAQAAFADCINLAPQNEMCWWQHSGYTGAWGHRSVISMLSLNQYGCWSMGAWGNQASSWMNNTNEYMIMLDAGNCTGSLFYLCRGCSGDMTRNDWRNDWLGGIQPCVGCFPGKDGKLRKPDGKVVTFRAKNGQWTTVGPMPNMKQVVAK